MSTPRTCAEVGGLLILEHISLVFLLVVANTDVLLRDMQWPLKEIIRKKNHQAVVVAHTYEPGDRRLRQEDLKFQISMGNLVGPLSPKEIKG